MRTLLDLEIVGLGIVFYSPFAVGHIAKGEDYLEPHFWEPDDVARHVNTCQISAFGTGSPGRYLLKLDDGRLDEKALESAEASARLGIEVRGTPIESERCASTVTTRIMKTDRNGREKQQVEIFSGRGIRDCGGVPPDPHMEPTRLRDGTARSSCAALGL